jgi:hypothetical protein
MVEEHTVTRILHAGIHLDGFSMKIRDKDLGEIFCDYVGRRLLTGDASSNSMYVTIFLSS